MGFVSRMKAKYSKFAQNAAKTWLKFSATLFGFDACAAWFSLRI